MQLYISTRISLSFKICSDLPYNSHIRYSNISHNFTLPSMFEFAIWSFIYTFQIIKSAQIQVTIINNCAMSRLHTLHKVINFNYLTFEKSFADRLNLVDTVSETIFSVNRLSSVNTENPVKSFSRRVNSVNTMLPLMTEWPQWKPISHPSLRWPSELG